MREREIEPGRGGALAGRLFGALALGVFGALVWAERRRALRERTEATDDRVARNLAVAGITAVAVQLAERPVVGPLARRVGQRRLGLSYWLQDRLALSDGARDALAIVLMDYTLYLWHVLSHRVPWLFRFHQVHHADLDLDTSTALRFHFGEFVAGVPYRAAQIAVVGVSPRALVAWQRLTGISVMFHHSNVRLPVRLERWLAHVVMTPRLHGIHHSIVREEQDSNWSSGLTVWDRLHGTYRANVPQASIAMGVADYRTPESVTLPKILAMPFADGAPTGRLPDGTSPPHRPLAARRNDLAP
jgi:sterol desaturase/sphingolipid hydroxylase (fatty acid hydroxylase superfamily)